MSDRRPPRHADPERRQARAELGARIAALARFRDLPRERLAEACGVTVLTISNWTRGEGEPGALDLRALARVLGVSVAVLLGEEPLVLGPAA